MSAHTDMREMLARRAELSPTQEVQLRDHLRSCPECRRTADAYARQTALLRALPSIDPPREIRARVLQNIHESRPAARRWPSFRPGFLAAPLAAALLVLVAALAYVNRPHSAAHTASGVNSVQQRPTAAQLQAPKPQKGAGLKNTAAPHHAPLPPSHTAQRSSSAYRASAPTPVIDNPFSGIISQPSPQEPQQPVVSQQLPPTAADIPARAPVATPPAVAAVAAKPTTRRATTQRPTYGPIASAAGAVPASTAKQQVHTTPTPAPLPPGIAVPGTPPAFSASPIRRTATPAAATTPVAAAPPTVPPSTPAATPIPVGVAASAPTPPAARAAPPAEPPAASPTPLATPTP